MTSDRDLTQHRASLLADVADGLRQRYGAVRIALSGTTGAEHERILAALAEHGLEPLADAGAGDVDLLVHLGPLPPDELARLLERRRGPESMVVASLPHGAEQVAVAARMRDEVAVVKELAQATVHGSLISDLGLGPGGPQVVFVDAEGHATPGAEWEHVLTIGFDVDAVPLPVTSVRSDGPLAPGRRAGPLRRLSTAVATIAHPASPDPAPILGRSDTPAVTIVLPVGDGDDHAVHALAAIPAAAGDTPYEVVVVDRGLGPDQRRSLQRIEGLTLVDGAVPTAPLLLLLAPDAIPREGSIAALVARATSDRGAGVVGAKLVGMDLALVEAGEVVWSDGSRSRIGRGARPDLPEHDVPRDVDCCAGAALLVRAELLAELPEVDVWSRPPREVDVDLCLRATSHGARVVVEPSARVIDLRPDAELARAPAGLLAGHPEPGSGVAMAVTRHATGRVLILDHALPTPDRDGGSNRMMSILRLLREAGWAVWFVPFDRLLVPGTVRPILELGVEVVGPHRDLTQLLRDLEPGLDVVILSRRTVAWPRLETVQTELPTVPLVFDTVDLQFLREELLAAGGPAAEVERARRGRWRELALCDAADQTWVVSDAEREVLHELVPSAEVRVIPVVHDPTPTPAGWDEREGLIFVGSYAHPPNVDAVRWLVEEILPTLASRRPDLLVRIVGHGLPEELRAALPSNARWEGWVPDLRAAYGSARVAIAPLRYGAGMNMKVTDALAHGVPVVTTPVGAHGLAAEVVAKLRVAEGADELVDATLALHDDPQAWAEAHRMGPEVVAEHYGSISIGRRLEDALEQLRRTGASGAAGPRR